jgi:hypothetical protein
MKSEINGNNTSEIEVQNISIHGLWLFVKDAEYFLPFEEFPWFKEAKIEDIHQVELNYGHHLHWSKLDIDLELESLKNPDNYPKIYR